MRDIRNGVSYFFGKWRGRVVKIDDANKQGRIQAVIPDVYGEVFSPWMLPCFPPAQFGLPSIGDQVWVEFEQGNPETPLYVGYTPSASTGAQAASPTMIAEDDETTNLVLGKGGGQVEIAGVDGQISIPEPITTSQPVYPNVRGTRIGSNFIEVDGTPNQARIHLFHESGAFFEFGASGQVAFVAKGARKDWTKGQKSEVVTAQATAYVGGNYHQHIQGSATLDLRAALKETIKKDYDLTVGGNVTNTFTGARTTAVDGVDSRQAGFVDDTSLGDRNEGTLGNKSVIITGAETIAIANSQASPFAQFLVAATGNLGRTAVAGAIVDIASLGYTLTAGTAIACTAGAALALTAGAAVTVTSGAALALTAAAAASIAAPSVALVAPSVLLGPAPIQSAIQGEAIMALLNTLWAVLAAHTHPVIALASPSGPSVELATAVGIAQGGLPATLSQSVKVSP